MEWGFALSAAAQAVSLVKDLREIDRGLGDAEIKLKLADLYTNLSDVKMALVDAQTEMREKDRELAALRASFALSGTLVARNGFKFFPNDDGKPKGFAICPRCEGVDGLVIQLVRMREAGVSACPQCKQAYDLRETFAVT